MTDSEKKLYCSMKQYNAPIILAPNQRITHDKHYDINFLEEKQQFKTCDGRRHNVWVRLGIIK